MATQSLQAQQFSQLLPIYKDYSSWNPASVSPSGLFNGSINYFQDYRGLSDAPKMIHIALHYPFKFQKAALGGHIFRHTSGGYNQTQLGASYRYKLNFANDMEISVGLGLGLFLTRFSSDRFIAQDEGDNLIMTDGSSSFSLNGNAGIVLRKTFTSGFASETNSQRLVVGFSVRQLRAVEESVLGLHTDFERRNHFYTIISYTYPLLPDVRTRILYTNSIAAGAGVNHTLLGNVAFYNALEVDLGFNTAGKIIIAGGLALPEILEDDNIRVKLGLIYDTKSYIDQNPLGVSLSIIYTYDYDNTSYEL
jgi:type IX secretion system PorP/SprF family membrane protein